MQLMFVLDKHPSLLVLHIGDKKSFKILTPGINGQPCFFINDKNTTSAIMFVHGNPIQPGLILSTGNTKGGSITVLLTSCLTGLD
jgi:hypothetical protein